MEQPASPQSGDVPVPFEAGGVADQFAPGSLGLVFLAPMLWLFLASVDDHELVPVAAADSPPSGGCDIGPFLGALVNTLYMVLVATTFDRRGPPSAGAVAATYPDADGRWCGAVPHQHTHRHHDHSGQMFSSLG
jgi:hypothetical protein